MFCNLFIQLYANKKTRQQSNKYEQVRRFHEALYSERDNLEKATHIPPLQHLKLFPPCIKGEFAKTWNVGLRDGHGCPGSAWLSCVLLRLLDRSN